MPMNVDTQTQYYGIYFSRYDIDSPAQDVLGELRRAYFEKGLRQKNKITREYDGKFYRYSYVLENGAPLKWKKMADGKLAEKAIATGEGGYLVLTQDAGKQLVKRAYFDPEHHWYKTEYYSSERKKIPAAVLSLGADDNILLMHEYFGEGKEEKCFQLYPCEIPKDTGELSLLNGAAGVPEVAAHTSRGDFYYCRREESQRRRTVLEAIRSGNQAPPLFTVERPDVPDEEADRAEGFQVTLHSGQEEHSKAEAVANTEQEGMAPNNERRAAEMETNLAELKRIQQEAQTSLRRYDQSGSYQWSGTVDAEKYLVEEDRIPPEVEPQGRTEEEPPIEEGAESGAEETEVNVEPAETEAIEEKEAVEKGAQSASEEPAAYTYSAIEPLGEPADAAEALESLGLSQDERQRLGRYNVIIQPISKNKYARPEMDAAPPPSERRPVPAQDDVGAHTDYEQAVLGDDDRDIPYFLQGECSGVSIGCPYTGLEKRKICVSPTENYYYFGGLSNGKREGYGHTVMQDGKTAYEGGYADDKRDGFGTYYYKTGRLCYAGEWKENRRHGMGVSFRPGERTIQVGRWQENVPVGKSALFDYNGTLLYSGQWLEGKRHGTGVGYADDGSILVGFWLENRLNGKGTQFDPDGNLLYSGNWRDGRRCGKGVEYRADGSIRYSGDWQEDLYYGKGILYREDGHTVSGDFINGEVCGQAEECDANGRKVYEGSWENSRYHGLGCKFLSDGGRCVGKFADGEPSGFLDGYTAQGELVYCGEWKDWKYHGEGCSYSGGEKRYEGSFREGRYHGKGYEYQDGSYVYSGEFQDNMRHGFGTSYVQGRPEYSGGWKDNRYEGAGLLYQNGKPRYAGSFRAGKLEGRVNTIVDGVVRVEGIYEDGSLIYARQFNAEGCLEYEGSVKAGKPAGMGCTFSPYGEKKEEGIFTDGLLTHSMQVTRRRMPPLVPCDRLSNTEYEGYRQGPACAVEQKMGCGLYSGQLKDGKPDGKGTILHNDHRYTGCFEEGEPRGKGVIYRMDGSTLRGMFVSPRHTGAKCLQFTGNITYFYLPSDAEENGG